MGFYPALEGADRHRLQDIAEVELRIEKERDFRASMYKKYIRGLNIVDGLDTALSTASVGLTASGIGLDNDHSDACRHQHSSWSGCVWFARSQWKGFRPEASSKSYKTQSHRVLAESKLNSVAERISRPDRRQDFWWRVSSDVVWNWEVQSDERINTRPPETGCWFVRRCKKRAEPARERRGDVISPYEAVTRPSPIWKNWQINLNIKLICLIASIITYEKQVFLYDRRI